MSFLNLWLDVSHQFWVIMTLSLKNFLPYPLFFAGSPIIHILILQILETLLTKYALRVFSV